MELVFFSVIFQALYTLVVDKETWWINELKALVCYVKLQKGFSIIVTLLL